MNDTEKSLDNCYWRISAGDNEPSPKRDRGQAGRMAVRQSGPVLDGKSMIDDVTQKNGQIVVDVLASRSPTLRAPGLVTM